MSSRFGRQQKRKMRAEIEKLSEAYSMQSHLLSAIKDQRDSFENMVSTCQRILGENWIAFPPRDIHITEEQAENIKNMRQYQVAEMKAPAFTKFDPMEPIKFDELYYFLEVLDGAAWLDDIKRDIHVRFLVADRVVGYALTRRTLQEYPKEFVRDILHKQIAHQLAYLLADEINQAA